jgi:hypothetical protein
VARTLLLELWIGVQCRCCAWLCLRVPTLSCLSIPCPAPAPPWLPQKLRAGLKAELGALYPLLLLKPVEAAAPESAHSVVMAAEGLLHVCSHPQVRGAGLVEGMGRLQRAAAAAAGHPLAALLAMHAVPVKQACVWGGAWVQGLKHLDFPPPASLPLLPAGACGPVCQLRLQPAGSQPV